MNGARIAPTQVPELKIPVASARSRGGNHSAVAFTAAGKLPLSPSPSTKRATPNSHTVLTSEWPIAATLQTAVTMA